MHDERFFLMSKHTILIVDDDPHIREVLQYALEKEGLAVIEADNGRIGLEKAQTLQPDMIVLDVMMPEMNGLDVCRELRRTQSTPILFLSSKDSELDKILGLELGGDDYVIKPFSPRELIARIKVMLRRLNTPMSNQTPGLSLLKHQDLTLDLNTFQVRWREIDMSLTTTEFNLVQTFIKAPNTVFTRDHLIEADIFKDIITDRTIDSHIRRVRQKFNAVGCANSIETVHGFGYKLGSCQ